VFLSIYGVFAVTLIVSGFAVMNRYSIGYYIIYSINKCLIAAALMVFVNGMFYYNHIIFASNRFGGSNTILGALFTLAKVSTILISYSRGGCDSKKELTRKDKKENKKEEKKNNKLNKK
jgi:hypothetical protein